MLCQKSPSSGQCQEKSLKVSLDLSVKEVTIQVTIINSRFTVEVMNCFLSLLRISFIFEEKSRVKNKNNLTVFHEQLSSILNAVNMITLQ